MERSLDHMLEASRAFSQSTPEAVEQRHGRLERALAEILPRSVDTVTLQEAAAVTKKLQASGLAVDLDRFAEAVLQKHQEQSAAGARGSSSS